MSRRVTLVFLLASIALAGCASQDTAGLPSGARLVGGGKYIEFTAPEAGVGYVMHPRLHKVVLTKSLKAGETLRWDDGSIVDESKKLMKVAGFLDPDDIWRLYFVPERDAAGKPYRPQEKPSEAGAAQPPDTIR